MVNETVGSLIQAAAEELAIVSAPDSLSTSELASCIDRLQRLVDRSNADRALIYGASYSGLLSLTANKQIYTIGKDPTSPPTSADIDLPRPVKITRANLLLSSTVRRPIMVTTDEAKWARIRYQQVYGPPEMAYYDGNFSAHGLASLYFFLIPDSSYQWEFWSWNQNPTVSSVNDTINYPPSYAQYWLYALAIAIAPMFGRTPSALIMDGLRDAKAVIRGLNTPSPEMATDATLLGDHGGYYNWLTGQEEDF